MYDYWEELILSSYILCPLILLCLPLPLPLFDVWPLSDSQSLFFVCVFVCLCAFINLSVSLVALDLPLTCPSF